MEGAKKFSQKGFEEIFADWRSKNRLEPTRIIRAGSLSRRDYMESMFLQLECIRRVTDSETATKAYHAVMSFDGPLGGAKKMWGIACGLANVAEYDRGSFDSALTQVSGAIFPWSAERLASTLGKDAQKRHHERQRALRKGNDA